MSKKSNTAWRSNDNPPQVIMRNGLLRQNISYLNETFQEFGRSCAREVLGAFQNLEERCLDVELNCVKRAIADFQQGVEYLVDAVVRKKLNRWITEQMGYN